MAKHIPLPSLEYLQERLHYDPDTGLFRRKKQANRNSDSSLFKPAGSINKKTKYVVLSFKKKTYLAHRIAWLLYYKQDPGPLQIDHIDRDRSNNKINNLRLVTNQQNGFNAGTRSNNTSGVAGVYWHKDRRKWQAYGNFNKRKHIGVFDSKDDAIAARTAWEQEVHSKLGL